MQKLTPFNIAVPQSVLDDLQTRLARTRWTDELPGMGWNYGASPDFLRQLVDYWRSDYDWRQHEAALNQFHQFKIPVNGVNIHFIYERGQGPHPMPLILTHGWPDSFYRFHKVIPRLTDPARFGGDPEQSFDVVVPSIPGFGFSDRTAMPDAAVAGLWDKLMKDGLGYPTFAAAGGDLGANISRALARQFPQDLIAIHVTEVDYPTGQEDASQLSAAEKKLAEFIKGWWMQEGAYNMIQSTKPQTLGYGLNDSPVGLAAWIVEKFYTWSGKKEDAFSKDELLTNVMLYWVTETINSSVRMYLENARARAAQPGGPKPPQRSRVPAAVAHFPADAPLPREWAERSLTVRRFSEMPRGGHFAALEEPELYSQDLQAFLGEFRKMRASQMAA